MNLSFTNFLNFNQGFARGPQEALYPNLWKGLLGHWLPGLTVEGIVTDGIRDYSLNGNYGTMNGTMTEADWVLQKKPRMGNRSGYVLDFDGTDDYVDMGNSSVLDPPNFITVSVWINQTSPGSSTETYISKGDPTGGTFIRDNESAGEVRFAVESTNLEVASLANAGVWQHYAMTYDGANIIAYSDGVEVGSTAKTGTLTWSADPWNIGARTIIGGGGTAAFLTGMASDGMVFDRALSPREIEQIYNGASPLIMKPVYNLRAPDAVVGGIRSMRQLIGHGQGTRD